MGRVKDDKILDKCACGHTGWTCRVGPAVWVVQCHVCGTRTEPGARWQVMVWWNQMARGVPVGCANNDA